MKRLALALCALPALSAFADEPPGMALPRWRAEGSRIALNASRPPSAVYFRRLPDRLCVEFSGVQIQGGSPGSPRLPGVKSIRWKQPDLSHIVCELTLNHRVPAAQLKVDGANLSLDLDYEWEDHIPLADGVMWNRVERAQAGRYLLWNEVSLDPSKATLEIGLAKDRTDSRERTTSMVNRHQALAGINGGYFAHSGGPLGIVYRQGKVVSPHVGRRPPRTTLGVMKDRSVTFDQMVAKKGQLASRSGKTWTDVELALGGGPRLLHRGQVALTTDEEELGPRGNDITRIAGRSCIATTRQGKIVLVTASGYHDSHLEGLRLEELATELVRRGASDAMNFDGGASTTMAVSDHVVSLGPAAPKAENSVATALLVKGGDMRPIPRVITLQIEDPQLDADGNSKTEVIATVKDQQGRSVRDGTVVRYFSERLSHSQCQTTTKDGVARFTMRSVVSPGTAKVWAEAGAARGEAEIRLTAGSPSRLWTLLRPAKAAPGKFSLTVQAVDRSRNPVRGQSVRLDERSQTTAANGQTTFDLLIPPGSPASVATVRCGELSATVAIPAVPALITPSPSPSPTPDPVLTPDPSPLPPPTDEEE